MQLPSLWVRPGRLLGLGTAGRSAGITILGDSEVGTPWVPAGQICWTLDFQTALITDPQPSTFWRVWSKYVIGEFLSQFCKVPSVSAVCLFYVVIKAVLGMRGRNEAQSGGGAGIDQGCLQPVLQSLATNLGKPRGSAKHSFTYRLCSTLLGDSETTRSPERQWLLWNFFFFKNVPLLPTFYYENIQTYSKVKGILQWT